MCKAKLFPEIIQKPLNLDDSGTLLSTFPFITNLSPITLKMLKKVVTDLESSNVCDSEEV